MQTESAKRSGMKRTDFEVDPNAGLHEILMTATAAATEGKPQECRYLLSLVPARQKWEDQTQLNVEASSRLLHEGKVERLEIKHRERAQPEEHFLDSFIKQTLDEMVGKDATLEIQMQVGPYFCFDFKTDLIQKDSNGKTGIYVNYSPMELDYGQRIGKHLKKAPQELGYSYALKDQLYRILGVEYNRASQSMRVTPYQRRDYLTNEELLQVYHFAVNSGLTYTLKFAGDRGEVTIRETLIDHEYRPSKGAEDLAFLKESPLLKLKFGNWKWLSINFHQYSEEGLSQERINAAQRFATRHLGANFGSYKWHLYAHYF